MQALILVDIQNDYFPGGRLPLVGSEAAALKASKLLNHFRAQKKPVIHIQHIATRPDATFFLPATPGAEIHESVRPQSGELVLQKNYPNSFRDTLLQKELDRLAVKEVLIVGMMTHMCIDSTVRAAFDLGYACTVAHDACATRDLAFNGQEIPAAQVHRCFLAALHGLFAQVKAADDLLC